MGLGKRSPDGTEMELSRGRCMPASGVRVTGETEGSGEADPEERMADAQNWHVTHLWWATAP